MGGAGPWLWGVWCALRGDGSANRVGFLGSTLAPRCAVSGLSARGKTVIPTQTFAGGLRAGACGAGAGRGEGLKYRRGGGMGRSMYYSVANKSEPAQAA